MNTLPQFVGAKINSPTYSHRDLRPQPKFTRRRKAYPPEEGQAVSFQPTAAQHDEGDKPLNVCDRVRFFVAVAPQNDSAPVVILSAAKNLFLLFLRIATFLIPLLKSPGGRLLAVKIFTEIHEIEREEYRMW